MLSNTMRKWLLPLSVTCILGGGVYSGAHAAPVYICVGSCSPIIVTDPTLPPPQLGKLVNILDVAVDGFLYDVAFVDGKFNDIFGTTVPALQFTTGDQAQKAAQALADTLIDVGDQLFDSTPSLTRGCSNDQACLIMTPFSLEIGDVAFRRVGFTNDNPFLGLVTGDSVGDVSGILDLRMEDFSSGGIFDDRTFAVWRRAASTSPPGDDRLNRYFTPPLFGATASVSEPGVLGLVTIGLVLAALRRRKR